MTTIQLRMSSFGFITRTLRAYTKVRDMYELVSYVIIPCDDGLSERRDSECRRRM